MKNREVYAVFFEEEGIPDWWDIKVFLSEEEAEEYAKKKNKYRAEDDDDDEDYEFCDGEPGYYVHTIKIPEQK